ncbi:class Ib ribonucleoside-diphosphate reductase assembly flavoprotein NrdI [Deinococcus aquaticus]|uniref:class Ib ribonucleoside-diphosphate reductase assembly flavoprotein NrdI n=1 Tax=Deinococcus aquaticus TaxID=328692 RepID=UPI00361C8B32
MRLVFDSLTGNVRRFALAVSREAGGVPVGSVKDAPPAPGEPFLLLTYTFGQGRCRPARRRSCGRMRGLRGVVSSGSYHWGANFGRAGDRIASEFRVPLVARLNKGGTVSDREQVTRWVRSHLPGGGKLWNAGLN